MVEYPPILTGSEAQQLAALRDYLVRVARSLEGETRAVDAPSVTAASRRDSSPGGGAKNSGSKSEAKAQEEKLAAIRRNAEKLRALIVKTAEEAEALSVELGATRQEMASYYLAKSDFGAYMEQAEAAFVSTARGVVESYSFASLIEALSAQADATDSYLTSVLGEIRRGIITDPGTGEQALGIAIAENLQFTGQVHTEGGLDYYELTPGQTLGLYTSRGWQFWVNGSKRGWFDSGDGSLHVIGEVVEDRLQLGASWVLTASGGLGIKYVGA